MRHFEGIKKEQKKIILLLGTTNLRESSLRYVNYLKD